MAKIKKIRASKEVILQMKLSKNRRVEVYSLFPVDRAGCRCRKMVKDWQRNLARMNEEKRKQAVARKGYLECPRDKTGMKRYEITCTNCKEVLAYCWATNAYLTDWCDLHYVSWVEDGKWHGCYTVHISPVDEKLCFECTCGQDTRDFRANMTMKAKQAFKIEEKNKVGRDFGRSNSKFKTRVVGADMLPFKDK
jgi:hypothetical protein